MTIHDTIKSQFAQQDQQLLIGGKSLQEIELMLGSTPFYAYDRNKLSEKVNHLIKKLPSQVKLHYAIKANPYPALVHYIAPLVDGFDVASRKEMLLALETDMSPKDISYAGPGKSKQDLTAAIVSGVTIHAESINELDTIILIATELDVIADVAIRINPAFELKSSGMKMSGGAKPFGIDEELVEDIIRHLNFDRVNLRGFHIFAGSQNLNEQAIIDAIEQTFNLMAKLIPYNPNKLDYINIGGGFGIPYFLGDKELDIDAILSALQHQMTKHQELINKTDLILELGRYLVGEAGVYVCKVVDKKHSREKTFLVCDGGMHHHLANSGNLGQVIRKNYPVSIGNKLSAESNNVERVNIVGPLCTPLDILAQSVDLPCADIGDYVVIYQSGAYGASASPQGFLSQPLVSEILL
ncbi:pyridoxal-dependent decarboxylase, exosortase A system-associated [Thalassotalea ganghwensis]